MENQNHEKTVCEEGEAWSLNAYITQKPCDLPSPSFIFVDTIGESEVWHSNSLTNDFLVYILESFNEECIHLVDD